MVYRMVGRKKNKAKQQSTNKIKPKKQTKTTTNAIGGGYNRTRLYMRKQKKLPCSARYWRANLVVHLAAIFLYIPTGAAHTVIPIQRQHAHNLATSGIHYIQTGRCVLLQKARRKRRRDYPDAKVETERGVPYSLRWRRKIVAALKLPRPESVDELETEIEERAVSIQKARRKRTLSHHSCIILQ